MRIHPGRAAARAVRGLRSVRIRLTLWYLLILAVVFCVFSAAVYETTVTAQRNAARAEFITRQSQLLQTYDETTHQFDLPDVWKSATLPPKSLMDKVQATKSDYPLGPFDVAMLINTSGQVTQTYGPIPPGSAPFNQLREWEATFVTKSRAIDQAAFFPFESSLSLTLPLQGPEAVGSAQATRTTVSGEYDVSLNQIQRHGQTVGYLVLAMQQAKGNVLQSLLPGLLVAGPITLLVAAIGGYWLATRAMRPVRLLTRTARAIEETDLSRRLNLRRSDELGELAATFDDMLGRLEAAFARQRQFTADASHELRTPLTLVSLETERALSGQRTPAEIARSLTIIQEEADSMSRLVNDLLLLARADAGQTSLQREPIDLSDVALEVVERLSPLARRQGVTLTVRSLPETLALGDRVYLAHLLTNLIENGIKFTAGHGSRVTISTGSGDAGDGQGTWAWARVEDDGPGIPPEHLAHLFDRFYRADAARSTDRLTGESGQSSGSSGSGLGLAIAQWIAQAHGGEIRVSSSSGAGSTFEVRLPLTRTEGAVGEQRAASASAERVWQERSLAAREHRT